MLRVRPHSSGFMVYGVCMAAWQAAAVIPSIRRMFGQPMFGHLHVVIRTAYDAYTLDKEKELQARFFGRVEDATASPPDVRLRNALRAAVGAEFQTIYVHLMPPALDADAVEQVCVCLCV